MLNIKKGKIGLLTLIAISALLSLSVNNCPAQQKFSITDTDIGNLHHWAYAATFGTGFYKVGIDKVFIFRIYPIVPLGFTKDRKISAEMRLPVTFGVQTSDLDKIFEEPIYDRFQTLSFVPGISLMVQINPLWTLRPYLHMGWGSEIQGNDSAWIFYSGLNSRYRFKLGKLGFGLLNAIQYQGYDPNHGEKDSFSRLVTGLEWDYPFGDKTFKGRQLYFFPHVAHYWYLADLKFLYINDEPLIEIKQEFEIALALGTKEKISILGLSFDRFGLAYITNDNIEGIRFVLGSIF